MDGCIQGFYQRGHQNKPDILIPNNQPLGEEAVKIEFLKDDRRFVSRSVSGVKIYDIRNYSAPIASIFDLACYHPASKFCLSPDEKYLLVPTSVSKQRGEEWSWINVYSMQDFNLVYKMKFNESSITDILWHAKTN